MSFIESTAGPLAGEPESSAPGWFTTAAPPDCSLTTLHLHAAADLGRSQVQQFIAEVYARHYGARLTRFMPTLASLQSNGRPCAAAGFRSARESLFLERYLSQPIERVLSAATRLEIPREQIVEVGQFVSARAGQGRRLMVALGHHLAAAGFRWVVSTATAELRVIFRRMGLVPLPLADADPARLGDEAGHWGEYYAHAPMVLAGDLELSVARLPPLVAA